MVIYPKKIVDSTKMRDLIEVLGLSIPLKRPIEENKHLAMYRQRLWQQLPWDVLRMIANFLTL